MKTVFFYGLFMAVERLREQGFTPHCVGIARLSDFGLRIGERATLTQSDGECCYGTVMQLDTDELKLLYSAAGVADYESHKVVVSVGEGDTLDAVTYVLPLSRLTGRNSAYAIELARVARSLKLPASYLSEIERWI